MDRATEFLYLLAYDPEIMPPAPRFWHVSDTDVRRAETHACLMHAVWESEGALADSAIVADSPIHPEAGPRWLDLCRECYGEVKAACELVSTQPFGYSKFWN